MASMMRLTRSVLAPLRCATAPISVRQVMHARASPFTMATRSISDAAREWTCEMNKSLEETDPELFDIIEHEKKRQRDNIVLIASENFTSRPTLEALGSVMQNKYSEGYPGARYYGGNEFIDQAESLCQKRALQAFGLNPEEWGVNVQTLSGSPANFAAYTAIMQPHDRILALDLPHGGHLSHGYQTDKKRISAVSVYFESMPYRLNDEGVIDYDSIPKLAALFRPKVIVAGASAYSREIDYARFAEIAKDNNAYLLADIAHVAGLMAAKVIPSAFEHCDIVTTTTHKSLRGPRGAMIFYRKGVRSVDKTGNKTYYDLEGRINAAVFPGLQGGPHNHTISALATALKQTQMPTFYAYQKQVVDNAQAFASALQSHGFELAAGGTDNHLLLMNLRPKGVDGARVESVLDLCGLATNKNTIVGDTSALVPSGLRMGTPAMTTRGATEEDFAQIAEFVRRGVDIAVGRKAEMIAAGTKKLAAFKQSLVEDPPAEIQALREEVAHFCRRFPTVGYSEESMRYK